MDQQQQQQHPLQHRQQSQQQWLQFHDGNSLLARSNTFPLEQHAQQPSRYSHPLQHQMQPQQQMNSNYLPHPHSQQQQQQQPYHDNNLRTMSANVITTSVGSTTTPNTTAATTTAVNGPRSKCNQVIYEAMTKACEIAVRGRCTDYYLLDNNYYAGNHCNGGGTRTTAAAAATATAKTWNSPYPSSSSGNNNNNATTANNNSTSTSTSTSSRFNIEVEEVEGVRSILHRWKHSLHVPLRLDIYYEHDSCYNDADTNDDDDHNDVGDNNTGNNGGGNVNNGGNGNSGQNNGGHSTTTPPPPTTTNNGTAPKLPQRELLERWCIDYLVPPSSSSSSHPGRVGCLPTNNNHHDKSSHIAQLKQMCKRIIVLLRSLHCLTRILPAYRLKCLLLSNKDATTAAAAAADAAAGEGWGSIGYSIYVSDCDRCCYEPEAAPSLPSPAFARQSFPRVPTPYGSLCLSVMYDATLNPNHMVADLAERRVGWLQLQLQQQQRCISQYYSGLNGFGGYDNGPIHNNNDGGGGGFAVPTSCTTATLPIPIQGRHVIDSGKSSSKAPNNQSREVMQGRRQYGSCPPAAMMGGRMTAQYNQNPSSLGRSPAVVSDYNIIPDYHTDRSPSLKPVSSPSGSGGIASEAITDNDGGGKGNVGEKRVMSGLSLAMMGEDGDTSSNSNNQLLTNNTNNQPQQSHHPPNSPEDTIPLEQDSSILRWQSSVTRAAFHHPPPTYTDSPVEEDESCPNYLTDSQLQQQQAQSSGTADRTALNYMKNGSTHFFQHHAGYGYGYNGSQVQLMTEPPPPPNSDVTAPIRIGSFGNGSPGLVPTRTSSYNSGGDYGLSISPSPLMSTPPNPQTMWKVKKLVPADTANTQVKAEGDGTTTIARESSSYSSQGMAPPFQNPTSLQPLPSPSNTHGGSAASTFASGHMDPRSGGSSSSPHFHGGLGKSSDAQRKRTSSSSSVLLPPVTSLDLLQKSPFSAARMAARDGVNASGNGGEREVTGDNDGLMMPSILGSYRDDAFTSSIPRMVSANNSRGRTGSIGGSTSGAGASLNLMPSHHLDGGFSSGGGYYATYYSSAAGASGRGSYHNTIEPISTSSEEMPFAVDDEPAMGGTSSPFGSVGRSSRSLWGGTTANVLDGTTIDGVSEITSSLAVSSLHHRCGTEGKPRLKLFGSTQTMESRGLSLANGGGEGNVENGQLAGSPMQDFATIKDQLSEFRNFGASLMVGSTIHDSRSE